jgi:hypothetical protein
LILRRAVRRRHQQVRELRSASQIR